MFFCFLLHLYFLCSFASIFNFHVGDIKICTEDLFAQWQGLLTSGSCCEVTREEPPHGSVRRVFLLVASVPERIPPVSCSRGTDTDADFHSISLLVTGSHACLKLRTSPVRLPSSVRMVASQLPRGIRWKRKPACLSGLRTASQLVLPSSVPAHTPASKGGVRFRSFPGFCRVTRLASWGLPAWRNGWQLSPAARSAAPRPPIFPPSHVPLPPRGGHVSRPLCPPGFCSFGP